MASFIRLTRMSAKPTSLVTCSFLFTDTRVKPQNCLQKAKDCLDISGHRFSFVDLEGVITLRSRYGGELIKRKQQRLHKMGLLLSSFPIKNRIVF